MYVVTQICFFPATSFPPRACTALRSLPSQCGGAGKGCLDIFRAHKYTYCIIWELCNSLIKHNTMYSIYGLQNTSQKCKKI